MDLNLIDAWLDGRPESTVSAYRRDALSLLQHAAKPALDVTADDVAAWRRSLEERGLSAATVGRKLAAVRSLYKHLVERDLLAKSPAAFVRMPKGRGGALHERILSETEVIRMIQLTRKRLDRALLRLLYAGGLRINEAVSIKARDVIEREPDAQGRPQGQVTVLGKGSKIRTVLVGREAWVDLSRLVNGLDMEERPFPFRRQRGWRIVKEAAKRAGIDTDRRPVSPHWLRHANATHALRRGADIALVSKTLGHASVATTSIYLHARPEDASGNYLAI